MWTTCGRARVIGVWAASVAGIASPLFAAASVARTDAVATIDAEPGAIRVPNDLSDEAWQKIPPVTGFIQREPLEGAAPSQQTEFRVAYSMTTLYIRVRAFDTEAAKITGDLTRRDIDSPSDWIRVMIDSYHDRRTAYEFAVNPAGVKQDRYWYGDTNRDDSWDAVWDVTVSRDGQGWSAEFKIPFSQLRFTPGKTNTFGFAVARQIGRLNETSTWPLLSRSAPGYVSSFGELGNLVMTSAPRRLEIVPYAVTSLSRQSPDTNPLVRRSTIGSEFGADLKYALTPGLTLTSTINPDFGQVEADPAVVNLTAFETLFAERRPFFIEGSGNFRFDVDCSDGQCTGLFYSRRIGRTPQGIDDLPSGDGVYTNAPPQTSIIGAAKLTGRVGMYSIGVMQAFTQEEIAHVLDNQVRSTTIVEPRTSYSVARVRREFRNQSYVGAIVTSTNRQHTGDTSFLPSSAVTGGADFDWRMGGKYSLNGYWAASRLAGSTEAIDDIQEDSRHYFQRPGLSADHLDTSRTSLAGSSARLAIGKIAGQRVLFNSTIAFKTPQFDIDDIGYLRRADQRSVGNWLQIKNETPNRWFNSRRINFNQWASWNFDGDRLMSDENVNAHAVFSNNWSAGGGYNRQQLGFDDRLARGGPGGLVDGYTEGWWYLNTDNRRRLSISYSGGRGGDGHGSMWRDFGTSVTARPMSSLQITGGVHVNRNVFDSQWIDNLTGPANHYVFGHLDQTTLAFTGRVNYTIRPTLSLQLYAQPFVSAGDYTRFKELVDGRNPVYARRYQPFDYAYAPDDNPDFNYRSFRTTNVLRWEYKPGSTLFVVWQQAREDTVHAYGDFRFGRDVGNIFAVSPQNVFLVKLAYWLNY